MSRTSEQKRKATAERIRAKGAPFVLTRVAKAYDSSRSRVENGPRQVWNSWAADWEFDHRHTDQMVRQDDLRLIVAAEDMTLPEVNDQADYAGVAYRVHRAAAIRQSGVAIAYDVHLTRR